MDVENVRRAAEQVRSGMMMTEADYARHAWAATALDLIAVLREAEDAMNVCARCGAAIDAEVAAEQRTTAAEGFDPSATTDNAR